MSAEPPVEYADGRRGGEAARSLGKALGVSPVEARSMLENGTAAAELRLMGTLSGAEARRITERRYLSP